MIVYKLLRPNWTTHNGHKWELNKTQTIDKPGNTLCSDKVFHAYRSARLAVLLNPIHASYDPFIMVECDTPEIAADDWLKIGIKQITILKEIEKPELSQRQKVKFAIMCEQKVRHLRKPITRYDSWADTFLTENDELKINRDAAYAAYAAADAGFAATLAAAAATFAAYAAAYAANAAAEVANAANVAYAIKIDFFEIAESI